MMIAGNAVAAMNDTVPIHVFFREGCVHCDDEKAFLQEVQTQRDDMRVVLHDIQDPEKKALFNSITEMLKLPKATPVTVVGNIVVQGFDSGETTGKNIIALLEGVQGRQFSSLEDAIAEGTLRSEGGGSACDENPDIPCAIDATPLLVRIPFTRITIDAKSYSLPTLAAVLGFIDGFNPCAMWVLITFLIVLLQIGDRRKVWQIAGLFIVAETVMYYLILTAWYTTWDFIGLDQIVTPLVGMIAIGGGFFFLYEGFMSDGTCKVTSATKRRKTHMRIQDIAQQPFTILSAIAVIGLALSVNIIEFACSIGIPQTFTKILELNALSFFERHALLFIYIVGYMIDDFIVFGIALWGIERLDLAHKYSRICNIVGGFLMLLLGALLVLNPEALRMLS